MRTIEQLNAEVDGFSTADYQMKCLRLQRDRMHKDHERTLELLRNIVVLPCRGSQAHHLRFEAAREWMASLESMDHE